MSHCAMFIFCVKLMFWYFSITFDVFESTFEQSHLVSFYLSVYLTLPLSSIHHVCHYIIFLQLLSTNQKPC